jgi:2-oxo-4-hydroxy-4-carboxy-5-ureidoimidazoline decarboxylase
MGCIPLPKTVITMDNPTVSELLSKPKAEILTVLGGIYEHSSWIAEEFYAEYVDGKDSTSETITNVRDIFQYMSSIVDKATREQKMELLCAHPDLCAKIDSLKKLTKSSQEEQTNAGLSTLTDGERNKFSDMNTKYRDKFGFPFILAARHVTKYTVLSAIEGRLQMPIDAEFTGALFQVSKIAWMRLLAAFNTTGQKGFLTCHVLDTANGCPGASMRVTLHRITPEENAGLIKEFITNDDGRLPGGPALKDEDFLVGTYQWTFYVGDYFARKNIKTSGVPFLDEIPLRFGIDDPEEHYHVPLLVSPWSYSTYRGS